MQKNGHGAITTLLFIGLRRTFSMRTMFLGVAVISIAFALWTAMFETRRKAEANIRRMGGDILYDYQCEYDETKRFLYFDLKKPSPTPSWLKSITGIDVLAQPVHVDFFMCEFDNGTEWLPDDYVNPLAAALGDLDGLRSVCDVNDNILSVPQIERLNKTTNDVKYCYYSLFTTFSTE